MYSELYLKIKFLPGSKHFCLGNKSQSFNAVWGNKHCLFWELYRIHKWTMQDKCRVFEC